MEAYLLDSVLSEATQEGWFRMRMAGVALVVVLVGLFAWWLSGPAPRKPRTSTAPNPFVQAKPVAASGNLSGLGQRTSWGSSGTVSTFPVRAPEPEIYTALVGDGPVSESGPGSVTELYPASRVSYITTTTAEGVPEMPTPTVRPREPEPYRPPVEPQPSSGRDHSLDAAIEGGPAGGAPGQIR
jgi:hypothetical protein